ncbi:MAG: hypothetical protein HW421_4109 [Ignavibacteria bacterium]|nr:hypothetical protein [Ignavibacteria bacterium]
MKIILSITFIALAVLLQIFDSRAAEEILIKTPLCSQPKEPNIIYSPVQEGFWYYWEIEFCKQTFLYAGGIYKKKNIVGGDFIDENIFLPNRHVYCMALHNIGANRYAFIGTDHGIYFARFYIIENDTIVDWSFYHICDQLEEFTIKSISLEDNLWFACTVNNGIWKSTDNGETWTQYQQDNLQNKTINCIIHDNNGNYYIAVNGVNGVYKSEDNGVSWNYKSLSYVNTLFIKSGTNYIYAGTEGTGLRKSINGGDTWELVNGSDNFGGITAVVNWNNYIFIGTRLSGCFRKNGDGPWSDNLSLSFFENIPINSLKIRTEGVDVFSIDYIYAATDQGLRKSQCPGDNWDEYPVGIGGVKEDPLTKMIYIDETTNNLWVACYGDNLYTDQQSGDSYAVTNVPCPMDPVNWGNYNCHLYAWHYCEGGLVGEPGQNKGCGNFGPPNYYQYVNKSTYPENYDYIETDVNDELWDKVTYSDEFGNFPHSATRVADVNNTIRVQSKWNQDGPLVNHTVSNNPYGTNPKRYWTSKKKVTGINIDDSKFIGRQIITEGATTILPGPLVEFYVAPMYEHQIHFQPGFHAPSGSNFHAYVKTDCEIPWRDFRTPKINANPLDDENHLLKNNNDSKYFLNLTIYPNPTSQKFTILTSVNGYDKPVPVNLKMYLLSGKMVKSTKLESGVETFINIDDLVSGSYLIAVEVLFVNKLKETIKLSNSKVIVINK